MKSIIQIFGVFLFTALLFLKVSAFHSYCHDDSNETQDCTVCIISLENQQENLDYTYSFDFVPEPIPNILEQSTTYTNISVSTECKSSLFGRPPPAVLSIV